MDVMNPAVAAHSGLGKVNPAIKLALGLLLTASFLVSADWLTADRKSTRLNSSHSGESRMPSSA